MFYELLKIQKINRALFFFTPFFLQEFTISCIKLLFFDKFSESILLAGLHNRYKYAAQKQIYVSMNFKTYGSFFSFPLFPPFLC